MKLVNNGQLSVIDYCHGFKEDIQQVVDLMTVNGAPPELISDKYEFADANEMFTYLGDDGKNSIRIRCRNPSVAVTAPIGTDLTIVEAADDSDASVALAHRVRDVLEGCQGNPPLRANVWVSRCAGFFVGSSLFFAGLAHIKKPGSLPEMVAIAVVVAGILVSVNVFTYRAGRGKCFYGVSRNSRKSFWRRKRDDLLANLITGAVGAILGAVLGIAGTLYTQAHTTTGSQKTGAQSSSTTSTTRSNSG